MLQLVCVMTANGDADAAIRHAFQRTGIQNTVHDLPRLINTETQELGAKIARRFHFLSF